MITRIVSGRPQGRRLGSCPLPGSVTLHAGRHDRPAGDETSRPWHYSFPKRYGAGDREGVPPVALFPGPRRIAARFIAHYAPRESRQQAALRFWSTGHPPRPCGASRWPRPLRRAGSMSFAPDIVAVTVRPERAGNIGYIGQLEDDMQYLVGYYSERPMPSTPLTLVGHSVGRRVRPAVAGSSIQNLFTARGAAGAVSRHQGGPPVGKTPAVGPVRMLPRIIA